MGSTMTYASNNELPPSAMMYLVQHMFLPPRLAHKVDLESKYETILLDTTADSLTKFKDHVSHEQSNIVDSVITMISNLRAVRESSCGNGSLNEARLGHALEELCKKGGIIPLHIRAQNAGVMISKVEERINVEVFELSPLNESVITTKGRLRRSFPGSACSLNVVTFKQPGLQAMIAHTLAKMSHQRAVDTQPKVRKAGQMHYEDRDTTHPRMISELFMGVLRPAGEFVKVSHLWKNTREEVMWLKSLLPWRRSSMWLLIRIAMQLVFSRSTASSNESRDLYKTFMVFLLSHVLELSHQYSLPSDLLYAMNAKLARRLTKLGSFVDGPGLNFVRTVMHNTNEIILARWSTIMEAAAPRSNLSRIESLDFIQDSFNALPALDEYLELRAKRENTRNLTSFQPVSALFKYPADALPTRVIFSTGEYAAHNLRSFEDWVASNLQQWLEHHVGSMTTCGKLGDLIQSYHSIASPVYSGNPEATSMMLLNILELWIACDKSAIHICEFLQDYNPGIPQKLLQSLILPFKYQMERLLRAEEYLSRRQVRAKFGAPCIFRDFGLPNCFSVRYFSNSSEHRELLQKIEDRATETRKEKCHELRRIKEKYHDLMRLYDQSSCEYHEVVVDYRNDFREQQHNDSSCRKCGYFRQANALDIRVHEWPLPSNTLQAWSTVFELRVPSFFGHWRDTTASFLLNVLKSEYLSKNKPETPYSLKNYQGLSSFFTSFSSNQRLGILSPTKPNEVTHRRNKCISITEERDVCVNNGLQYGYYDESSGTFVDDFSVEDQIPTQCTYKLPERSKSVQQFLFRTPAVPNGPSPNTVIASQSACPDHMSLEEYKALSTVPLGYRIQWQNILLQLSAPSVDFKKVETSFVILQCIHQTGPGSNCDVLRSSHEVLHDETFAHALLASLHESSHRVKENWESSQALGTFISVALRLLSLASAPQTRNDCLSYLSSVRAIAFSWVNHLRERAHEATNDNQRADLMSKSVEIALICADSFHVEERYLDDILAVPEDASVFIQCSIVIHKSNSPLSMASKTMTPILYWRWKWLSYRSYPVLVKRVVDERGRSLDDAIKKLWPAYQAGDGWRTVSEQTDYWLVSQTASQSGSDSLEVHFNLLTGELLVNGLPLARLPSDYEQHPTYRTLFGQSVQHIMPSHVPGMQFSGRNKHAGFTLHLGMSHTPINLGLQEGDLLVQATKDDRSFELIPSRVLRGELPVAFVDKFVQWYDVTDDCLEFRRVEDPWTSSPNNWKLKRAQNGSKWHLIKYGISLVSVKSKTAKELSSIFSPLEDPFWIHIIFHHSSSSLEIELPRLRLGFLLKSGESSIQSRQFRGMMVDPDQSLGTLVGLCSKFMLKHENDGDRLLIIPEGQVSYKEHDGNVHVNIDKSSAVKAHAYFVDSQIGRLIDNGSLQSKLLLCYLHALTSFCLPDPLIRRTGTEQALSILNSAAVKSAEIAQENVEILGRIARMTPCRSYYPLHERVMQTVKWSPVLGFLAQHGGFYKSVKSLFAQADRANIFHPESRVQQPSLNHVDCHLLERDCIRSSTFRVSGFGAENHTVMYDATYEARDRGQNSTRGSNAYTMSSIIYHGRTALHYPIPSNFTDHIWRSLARTSRIFGPSHSLDPSELMYDAELLLDSSELVSTHWITLHRTLSRAYPRVDKFHLMMWLSTLAVAKNADMKILQTLALFFTVPDMAQIFSPSVISFHLSKGAAVKKPELRQIAQAELLPFRRCPEANLSSNPGESKDALNKRRKSEFQSNQRKALDRLTNALVAQWPCEIPASPTCSGGFKLDTYVAVGQVVEHVKPRFKTWFDNHGFYKYLSEICDVLHCQSVDQVQIPSYPFSIPAWDLARTSGAIFIEDILNCPAPLMSSPSMESLTNHFSFHVRANKASSRLAALIQRLEAQISSKYEKDYVEDLRRSEISLQKWGQEYDLHSNGDDVKEILLDNLSRCREHVRTTYESIISAIKPGHEVKNPSSAQGHDTSAVAAGVGQWPRLSPLFLLQQLSRTRWSRISSDWKKCIVHYALSLNELQRADRLVRSFGNQTDFVKELRNPGHKNWNPLEYPESLLLEVESGIMIRDVQEQIAQRMRHPQSNRNAVMQLNMGEGKSSVIVPMVAAALANGSRLVRVIVAKPQSKQMLQMLVSKMGGLLDRRVYHMPFSRSLKIGEAEAHTISGICRECMTDGGILLVQPEHILSLKLMSLECLVSGKETVGRSLMSTQEYFDTSSRDIIDESDENFSVKFELIYTMGMQRPVELSPERWTCIHQVLELVRNFVPSVEREFPGSLEVNERCAGSFPRTRILHSNAQQRIFSRTAEHICETGLNGFPIARQPRAVRQAVFQYITKPDLTSDEIIEVEKQGPTGFWADTTSNTLLLLRGLIAGGVLPFAFGQKRWRVNYGLAMTRQPPTKLAVPYRAKDSPTPRSEFSHPDVVIVLTSLSYYYGGLENDDLFLAFSHLLKSDHADIEYQDWVKDAPSLTSAYRQLVGVNLKDHFQCIEQVFPPLRFAKSVIDYFLSHIIFPKEMKEFPHKLSVSGWDLGQIKTHPTTGFSGTNDSRNTLPLDVEQLDLQEHKHTNALVLEYLLQPENSVAVMPSRKEVSISDAELLLTMVANMEPPIQVILDVGAQILELSNLEVAKAWLEITPDHNRTQAVLFFSEEDEISVIDRQGHVEPLQTSSFAKQLDVCLIYLDEIHTRGTDLRLPEHYRAAVTLGANLTKDRLVQACMRMRKLGQGQSVVFCIPPEIKTQMLGCNSGSINVSDVLSWAVSETYTDMQRSMPLWAAQGVRFVNQRKIWKEARIHGEMRMSKDQAERFLEDDAQTLEDRYRPCSGTDIFASIGPSSEDASLGMIVGRCRKFDSLKSNSAKLREEQERELSPEIEQERQVQRLAPAQPAKHHIHPDLIKFVSTGVLIEGSSAYKPAFEALRNTSAAAHLDVSEFGDGVLVTADFASTVQVFGTSYISDVNQRPIQWILMKGARSSCSNIGVKHMMIISPYEAQELYANIRTSKIVAMHMYAPRPNLGFRALDGLDLYTVPAQLGTRSPPPPPELILQLNMFAGQLFFGSFIEYVKMCEFLGLAWDKTGEGSVVAPDGFILSESGVKKADRSRFSKSPVRFLQILTTKIRRNCEGIDKTHMGIVLDGRLLRASDFPESERS